MKDHIKSTGRQLMRITKMYARIEAMTIPVGAGVNVTTREARTIQAIGEPDQMHMNIFTAGILPSWLTV